MSTGDKSPLDPTELDLPDTVFARDIDDRVFQKIVAECLSHIDGVTLPLDEPEGNIFSRFLGKGSQGGYPGIVTEQDEKSHSVKIQIDVAISYGESIPEKAEEVQSKVSQEVTSITGLHVSCVHVIFKNVAMG